MSAVPVVQFVVASPSYPPVAFSISASRMEVVSKAVTVISANFIHPAVLAGALPEPGVPFIICAVISYLTFVFMS